MPVGRPEHTTFAEAIGPNHWMLLAGLFTCGSRQHLRVRPYFFDVDAELIVFGKTDPSAVVSVAGRPVKLQEDGSFTVRMEMPDKRQVLPLTAESRDGIRQRTTVIAVERNTKVMEPIEVDDRF